MKTGEREQRLRREVELLVRDNRFELPPIPVVAQEVFAASNRPTASIEELARIAHRDAFIAGRVLRVANSAHYGFRRPAATLREAIVRIGIKELRNILFVLGMKGEVFQTKEFGEFAESAWHHSLATAIAASLLASTSGKVERHRAFLAGLLHDVGVAVVLKAFVRLSEEQKLGLDAALELFPGVAAALHARIGGLVAGRWRLDPGLKEVISAHHRAETASMDRILAQHVAVADMAALHSNGVEGGVTTEELLAHPSLPALDIAPAKLEEFLRILPIRTAEYDEIV